MRRPAAASIPACNPAHPAPGTAARRGIGSRALFGDARTRVIHHAGTAYLLRITRQGKLILTK